MKIKIVKLETKSVLRKVFLLFTKLPTMLIITLQQIIYFFLGFNLFPSVRPILSYSRTIKLLVNLFIRNEKISAWLK